MKRPLIILGASGNALDVLDVVDALNAIEPSWEVIGLLDDGRVGTSLAGIPVVGELRSAKKFDSCWFLNAIGSDRSFRRRTEVVAATGLTPERFATLIHPRATVSTRCKLGYGICLQAGACLAGHVNVGNHVWLAPGTIIGHDTTIADHAVVAPGAVISGGCRLAEACYVGAAAAIRQQVRIGAGALVGLGAVVVRDVPAGLVVVGNPARPLVRADEFSVPLPAVKRVRG